MTSSSFRYLYTPPVTTSYGSYLCPDLQIEVSESQEMFETEPKLDPYLQAVKEMQDKAVLDYIKHLKDENARIIEYYGKLLNKYQQAPIEPKYQVIINALHQKNKKLEAEITALLKELGRSRDGDPICECGDPDCEA